MTLLISDTLRGAKRPFRPLGQTVRMYVCGMTPKEAPHVGHAFMFVQMDMIRRYLDHLGYAVRHVQNFTDVDDKIIDRARSLGRDPLQYAREQTDAYFEVMDRLRVQRAHEFPTVTASLDRIIAAVRELIAGGHAYATSQGVYFAVNTFASYGKLSRRSAQDVAPGARVEVDPEKRDPRDFALWKRADEGEIGWQSPWGRGRPGWHIECSTMIRHSLGDQIDIHGGGADLIFPHHENEIAQAEAGGGCDPFVGHWLHTGLMLTEGEKMAHSLGNFTTVASLLEDFSPDVLRLHFLSVHYRSPLTFSRESIEQSQAAYDRLLGFGRVRTSDPGDAEAGARLCERTDRTRAAFLSAMDDDFNAPKALGTLFELGREIHRLAGRAPADAIAAAQAEMTELLAILGIQLVEPAPADGSARPYIQLLLAVRAELREAKQWQIADRIRAELDDLGVILEDADSGTTWRRK